jgi:predicted Fe-Mo cluster-binding NifX family protein
MKIAISSTGKTIDNPIDTRFGRCEYFQIYDTESENVSILENKGHVATGGAGIASAQQIIDKEIDVIITGSLGPNAFELIDKAGIKACKCHGISVKSALEKYNKGELLELKEAGPSHH